MKNTMMIINSMTFILLLIVGGVLFWVMPRQLISQDEKRNLADFPLVNQQTLLSGKFERSFEEFYNDHFIFRDAWMGFAEQLTTLKGIENKEFKVITAAVTPEQAASTPESLETPEIPATSDPSMPIAPATPDGTVDHGNHLAKGNEATNSHPDGKLPINANAVNAVAGADELVNDFSKVKGVIVVNGRVVQNFGGSKATAKPFADLLNRYRETLDPSIKMYAMVIPAGSDFYLPEQVNNGVMKEKENIAIFNTLLAPGITSVPAYEAILPHKDDYIMFRTDHHWTGLGAYYAYTAFAKSAGLNPLSLSELQHVEKPGTFLGSLYKYTRDNSLKDNPDTLDYYKIPTDYTATLYNDSAPNGSPWKIYAEDRTDYTVFLGGDIPLMKVKTDNPNNRKILIVKDSFGNALSTYFAANYSEVYIIDYRSFKGNIPKLMADNGIGELLFAFNTFAANSNAVVKYGDAMLK